MSNYVYEVWDKMTDKILGTYNSQKAAKKGLDELIRIRLFKEDNIWGFWEDCLYEIRKVNKNSPK